MTEKISTVITVTFIGTHIFKCHISGRSELVYKISKADLLNLGGVDNTERDLFDTCGIYLLFSENGNNVYVGQADVHGNKKGILTRLKQQTRKFEFSYAIVIVDKQWDGSALKYLERKFWELARGTTLQVLNHNRPNDGDLDQAHRESLNNSISFINLLIKLLGHGEFDEIGRTVLY